MYDINFYDFTKVWLDKVPQDEKILGLITENNAAGIGDRVLIMETRPLSATKRWRVVEIIEKAK